MCPARLQPDAGFRGRDQPTVFSRPWVDGLEHGRLIRIAQEKPSMHE